MAFLFVGSPAVCWLTFLTGDFHTLLDTNHFKIYQFHGDRGQNMQNYDVLLVLLLYRLVG